MRLARIALMVVAVASLYGCGAMTPYESSFQCPAVKDGKCVTMQEAYEESKKAVKDTKKDEEEGEEKGNKNESAIPTGRDDYRESLYRELSGLLKDPVTPVINPPKVVRALILPYPDSETLFMPRYVYIMVDKPVWVLDDGLVGINGEGR